MMMTNAVYTACVRLGEVWVVENYPPCVRTCDLGGVALSRAVYIHCDAEHRPLYVGSVCRPTVRNAVGRRLAEHGRSRLSRWHWTYLVRFVDGAAAECIRAVEGRVILFLRPPENVQSIGSVSFSRR